MPLPSSSGLSSASPMAPAPHPVANSSHATAPTPLPVVGGAMSVASHTSAPVENSPAVSIKDQAVMETAGPIFDAIDRGGEGSISKLDLVHAVQSNNAVNEFVLPDIPAGDVMQDSACFDAVDSTFRAISGGKRRIRKHTFVRYYRKASVVEPIAHSDLRMFFNDISEDGSGFTRLQLMDAVQRNSALAELLLPGEDCADIMNDTHSFDALDAVFDEIAGGKQSATFEDFDTHVRLHQASAHHAERSNKRVLIVEPGFCEASPHLGAVAERAGYQIHWVASSERGIAANYLSRIQAAIKEVRPHLVACASKGGQYVVELWQTGLWRGPTLMINVHPAVKMLPQNVPIVLAHGSNDAHFRRTRENLEQLLATGSANMCCLYYSANSGKCASGQCSRLGDTHTMDSLLAYDLLPRLMDAAMSQQNPETHLLWSWQHRLSKDRLEAEQWLSYCPDKLRRFWASSRHRGRDDCKLYEVPRDSQEFEAVAVIFSDAPRETPAYTGAAPGIWKRTKIQKVERIENGLLEGGSAEPYYESLQRCIEEQGIPFEEGVHTRWAFHGTDAIDSIVLDPVTGFQPLASGSRLGTLWGSGTYFARDARYVVESNFCSSKKMLLCLLMTGIPCLGDPEQHGILPYRQYPHRYNSAVDSLSSPEVFVLQYPGAAYPAYVITFS